MIGYHYTKRRFLESIAMDGLKLREIEGIPQLPSGTKGIWLFRERLLNKVEKAFVLRQMTKFDCSSIVLLEVEYEQKDLPVAGYGSIEATHTTNVEDRKYESQCTVLFNPIPPNKIKLLGTFRMGFQQNHEARQSLSSKS